MKYCICNKCDHEFEVENFEMRSETMKDGTPVEVMFFTCPKCGDEYVVTVFDEEAKRLRDSLKEAQRDASKKASNPQDYEAMRIAQREMQFRKKRLHLYVGRLKRKYRKEHYERPVQDRSL